ncbi:MAG: aminotransferase class I/II-fold pyridoxal phosphate-dependent enzyme [bacterium]|nr:aminotransferase class I/II-fold pyridoxal phosphate-dependent enzyme [bacterium]
MSHKHGGDIYNNNIKYDFSVNLNPCGCPEPVLDALKRSIGEVSHYPDISQKCMREDIADLYGVNAENIICGSGASEIFMAAMHMICPAKALILSPSFYGYEHALNCIGGCEIIRYELNKDFGFVLDKRMLDELADDLDVLILANPNNPTGRLIPEELLNKIADVCDKKGIYLIVDECFLRLSASGSSMADSGTRLSASGVSMAEFAVKHKKVIVADAFTKTLSIPGVRIGYAVSSEDNVKRLAAHLPEWNISVFAEAATVAGCNIIKDGKYLDNSLSLIEIERKYLTDELANLGITVYSSDTLYLLIYTGRDIYGPLLNKGIMVRDCRNFTSLTPGYYRIAVKDHEANTYLIRCLKEVLCVTGNA